MSHPSKGRKLSYPEEIKGQQLAGSQSYGTGERRSRDLSEASRMLYQQITTAAMYLINQSAHIE